LIGIFMCSFLLEGCWDVKYLDELAIVIAIGLDKSGDQEIEVTVQIVNPVAVPQGGSKGGGGAGTSGVVTYSETGRTVFEAVRKIATKSARRLYFSHTQLLVIGEDLARKGVAPLFEFIERDPEVRTDFYAVVAKGVKASDVLKISTTIETIPGNKIHDSIDNVEKVLGTSYGVTIRDVIENIRSDTEEIAMGVVEIIGDKKKAASKQNVETIDPKAVLTINGMTMFKNEKLVGFLSPRESRGDAWIENKVRNTVVNIPCKNKRNTTIEVMHSSTKTKAKFEKGKPYIVIHVQQEANIGESICPELDVSEKKTLHQLEKGAEKQIKLEILAAITRGHEWKTDIFGFADAVYKKNPAFWKENKNNWEDVFRAMPVQIQIDTKIRREGVRNKSYFKKAE
jgi:spore germination protein KC